MKPSPASTTISAAIQSGAIGFINSLLSNQYVPSMAAQGAIAGALPLMTPSDRATLIGMAQEQAMAGELMMLAGSAESVPLFDIPVQPGVQANKVQVDVRVEIYDPTRTDANGQPIQVTRGIVTCTASVKNLDESIAECVDSWVDNMTENIYRDLGGVQIVTDVTAARRGAFFGK